MTIPSQTKQGQQTAYVGIVSRHFELVQTRTTNMSKHKKKSLKEETIPNFTGHPYSNVIQDFAERDRLTESELSTLECHEKYCLECSLNSFNDAELNDHLYQIYYAKRTDSTLVL